MLLTTLSLFHVVAGLLSRDQLNTIFDRDAFPAAAQLRRYGVSLLAIVAITTIDILERIFGTGRLTGEQWGICIGLAAQPPGHRGAHQARAPRRRRAGHSARRRDHRPPTPPETEE